MATLSDVAKKANVSKMTVSLADGFGEGFNGQLTIVADAASVTENKAEAFADAVKEIKELDHVASVTPAMPNKEGNFAIITVVPETGPMAKWRELTT